MSHSPGDDSPLDEKDLEIEKTESQETTSPRLPESAHTKGPPDVQSNLARDPGDLNSQPRGRQNSTLSHATSTSSQRTASDDAHDHQVTHHRSRSRAQSSTRSVYIEATRVPRSARRGLLAQFCCFDEVTNAWHYSRKKKWTLTAIVAIAGAAAPLGSAIVLPALVDIGHAFDTSPTVVNLSVSMYMLSMSIFPLWWSSFSETLGRRSVYVVSFFLFLVFNVLAAVSTDIAMFIVMRILSGGAAASVQAVGAGTISDIWEVKERGRAMGLFYLGPLCGPLLAPIIGGVLAEELGWRSTQWFQAIFGAVVWAGLVFFLPETLRQRRALAQEAEQEAAATEGIAEDEKAGAPARPTLSRTTTKTIIHVKSKKYLLMARRVFLDPLRIVLYLQFPAVVMLVMLGSAAFGALYMMNIAVQQTFSAPPYNYSSIIVGTLYIPNSVGYFLASVYGGRWVDAIMHREARKAGRYDAKGKLQFIPEDRMKENAWFGAILFPSALLGFGWLARYHVNVAAPLVFNFFFGVGSMLIFALVTTMLTEFMPRKASNGIALNNFVRNIVSCVGTIVTEPLIVAIGTGWLFTGIAVICYTAGFATIWSMKRFGPRWRISMGQRMDKITGD